MVTAVRTEPIRPPRPWMPNTSSESSKPSFGFTIITNQQQAIPAIAPSRIAPNGPELPAAGVTATRPAIAPEQAPSSEPLWPSARSATRSEEHTSELQSLMRTSYAVFCLTKQKQNTITNKHKSILSHVEQHHHIT